MNIEVNFPKTKIFVFRKRGRLKNDEHWFYANEEVEVVNDFNYLGITLYIKLHWEFFLKYTNIVWKGIKGNEWSCFKFKKIQY
jgi:hypothetical protein